MLHSSKSHLEDVMAADLDMLGLKYQRDYKFHPDRKWLADFALVNFRILIEVEGGTATRSYRGRHVSPTGYKKDCEKYTEASILGWMLLRFTTDKIGTEEARKTILRAISARWNNPDSMKWNK